MYKNYKNVELVKPAGLDLKDRLVGIQRVTKVTKGGRAFGFSAIVVVGDENGVVGHGLGKAKEVMIAISKAVEDAKKNLVRIPLFQLINQIKKYCIYWTSDKIIDLIKIINISIIYNFL